MNYDQAGKFFYVLQDDMRVLFVDDDPILREFAVVNLTTEHASVETADDGVAALAAIESALPDMVLLDLEMPNMDGFEALKVLRASDRTRDLPVIVVTGREDVEAIDRAFQAGATSFVVKPLNWRLLSYQIRYVLRTTRRELAAPPPEPLYQLALESARFLSIVLAQSPALKPAATDFARVTDAILQRADAVARG